jgi:hypothetical protein
MSGSVSTAISPPDFDFTSNATPLMRSMDWNGRTCAESTTTSAALGLNPRGGAGAWMACSARRKWTKGEPGKSFGKLHRGCLEPYRVKLNENENVPPPASDAGNRQSRTFC